MFCCFIRKSRVLLVDMFFLSLLLLFLLETNYAPELLENPEIIVKLAGFLHKQKFISSDDDPKTQLLERSADIERLVTFLGTIYDETKFVPSAEDLPLFFELSKFSPFIINGIITFSIAVKSFNKLLS